MTYGARPVISTPPTAAGTAGVVPAATKGEAGSTHPEHTATLSLPTGTDQERIQWMADLKLSEAQIQKAIMDHLARRAPGGLNKVGGVLVIHPPNGGRHQATDGQRIFHAIHGVLSGTPDLLLFYNGKKYALELKTLRGKLSAKQQAVGHLFRMQGFETCCAYGLFEALAWLERHGLLVGRMI